MPASKRQGSIHPAHFQELKKKYSYDPNRPHQGDTRSQNIIVEPVSPVMGAEAGASVRAEIGVGTPNEGSFSPYFRSLQARTPPRLT